MTIQKTVLSNKLTILTDTLPTVKSVAAGLWIGAGSVCETENNNGVAHFFEHMAFKGTPTRSALDVSLAIDGVGGYLNAYTSREVTAYHGKTLSQDAPLLLDVLSDIVLHPLLEAEEMEKERTVILQELMQSIDTPDDIVFDYFQEMMFKNQSLARPILGTEESIKRLTPEMLKTFLQRFYGPDRTVIVASGNIDHETHVAAVKQVYDAQGKVDPYEVEKHTYYGGIRHHVRSEMRQAQVLWGYQAPPRLSPEGDALKMANVILSAGMSSRLVYEVREKAGLVYTISSFYQGYRDTGFWAIYGGTAPEKVEQVLECSLRQVYNLADKGPTAKELEQARKQVAAQTHMAWESVSTRARIIGEYHTHTQCIIDSEEEVNRLSAVTADEIRDVLRAMISTPVTSVVLASERAAMPTDAMLKTWNVSC
ncbi:MAG: pitrilysin family protein [Alphaproteobacteria bacterium]|nr:pitrilysin family protein [Alphaproteobacteria bacterium]